MKDMNIGATNIKGRIKDAKKPLIIQHGFTNGFNFNQCSSFSIISHHFANFLIRLYLDLFIFYRSNVFSIN